MLLCVIYISSIVYNTLCILTVLFNKTIWFLAFDTLFELIIIAIIYVFYVILKAIVHLNLFLLPQKNKNIIIIGPYEIRFISIFLYSVLMVKLYFIIQKASLINWVLQFYLYQILFSIIFWIPF